MFDKLKFKVAVTLAGSSMREVAKEIDVDITTLYRKINGESDFYRHEIQKICTFLKIENPNEIFFA